MEDKRKGSTRLENPKSREEQAREYIGQRKMPGDAWNIFMIPHFFTENPSTWGGIKPVQMYEAYVKEKYPDIAETIIRMSDQTLVANLNTTVLLMNDAIGTGVSTQAQATTIQGLLKDAKKIIYGEDWP